MTTQRIHRSASDGPQLSLTLPPEVVAEGVRRLAWLALIYCGASAVVHLGRRVVLVLTGSIDPSVHLQEALGAAAVLIGAAVCVVARSRVLSPMRVLDVGLVFQVTAALGIAASEFWGIVPRLPEGPRTLIPLVPAECVWIAIYPLVVPNTPGKILATSLVSASMAPATVVVSAVATGTPIDRPLVVAIYFLSSTYLSAVVSYMTARIVYRFSMRLTTAREIGSYELIERIGQGGMGEVWRAQHRLLARPAAIKLIRSGVLGSSPRSREVIVRRFEREARDTAALRSTHTIDIYDYGVTEDGDFYYVMELLEGLSLERLVRMFGPLAPGRAVYILKQVCHSLGEAHARGLVHRDIKPANILVCRLGPDDDFVKVLDFGLVKHVAAGPTVTSLSTLGTTAGTPAYLPPEIALGWPDVDGRADLYSLGCVAYFLLTGQPVFSADTAVATALAHVQQKPLPPGLRSRFEIPSALEALIMACLSKDPRARPASADDAGRRLAATVPPDAWTPEDARQWWEQHLPAGTAADWRKADSKRSLHSVEHDDLVGHAALVTRAR
jgi:eukaryotic-like serine/threonine-protein kinase